MSEGIIVKTDSKELRPKGCAPLFRGAAALCLFLALWGSICGMADLPAQAALPLLSGGLLAAAPVLSPEGKRRGRTLLGLGLLAGLLLLLLRPGVFLDGCKYLLNRLFAASEARQSYVYEKFAVGEAWAALRFALLPLGLFSGCACGGSRRGLGAAVFFFLLCGGAAWLGVSPPQPWPVLLILALTLQGLLPREGSPSCRAVLGVLAALAALCAAVFLLFPGEDAALSAWEETARDRLSRQSVAYVELPSAQPTAPPERDPIDLSLFQTEDTPGALWGAGFLWSRPLSAPAVILLFALVLFVPAIFSDWTKKRRERNRAGLEVENIPAAVRSGFRYALRWLTLGGLPPENRLYGSYAPAVEALFSPELRRQYEAVLPLWREAAYSEHPMTEAQRAEMRRFAEQARETVWAGLGKRGRFLARYIYAL